MGFVYGVFFFLEYTKGLHIIVLGPRNWLFFTLMRRLGALGGTTGLQ
jgi:hypothetical protein